MAWVGSTLGLVSLMLSGCGTSRHPTPAICDQQAAAQPTLIRVRQTQSSLLAEEWRTPADPAGAHAFAVAGDLLVVAENDKACAVRLSTGSLAWTRGNLRGVQGNPVVQGGNAIVRSRDGTRMWSLRVATGELVWSRSIAGAYNEGQSGYSGAGIWADDQEVVEAGRDGLVAYRARDGSELWHSLQSASFGAMNSSNHEFVAAADGVIVALDAGTGSQRWHRKLDMSGTPITIDRDAIVSVVGGRLTGLDARSGATRWSISVEETGPWLADHGQLYVLAADGTLRALDLSTGRTMWQLHGLVGVGPMPSSGPIAGPRLADGPSSLYAVYPNGEITSVGMDRPAIIAKETIASKFPISRDGRSYVNAPVSLSVGTIAVGGDLVILGDDTGVIHVVNGLPPVAFLDRTRTT